MQHGANFFFAIGELLLNTIPFVPHLMGFVGFWTSLFGIWGAAALLVPHLCDVYVAARGAYMCAQSLVMSGALLMAHPQNAQHVLSTFPRSAA